MPRYQSPMNPPPVALTIAGSDCSSGAGIQADLKTFQHFHVHGLTAVTCVVSETAKTVRTVHPVPVPTVLDQTSLLCESFPVAAIKTGMLFSADLIHEIATLLRRQPPRHLVVDPVMVASTGDPLLEPAASTAYIEDLLPLATLATPNLPEAEALLGRPIPKSGFEPAAHELSQRLGISILLKGGHGSSDTADDLLIHEGIAHWFRAPRIATPASHGTGCTLSAAITACLALGDDLPAAVARAKTYIRSALTTSYSYPGDLHALNQGTLSW